MMKKNAARFKEKVLKYQALLIYIPGSPDPDAIASAYALKEILKTYNIKADIFAEKELSLPQNQLFLNLINIPVFFGKEPDTKNYEAYIVPDFQNNLVENISDELPCVAHIDHHSASSQVVPAEFSLIRTDAGSTSTLVTLLLEALGPDLSYQDLVFVSTALVYGIQTDTDQFHHITRLDIEALDFLIHNADQGILKNINSLPPPKELLGIYRQTKDDAVSYRGWGFYGLGYISSSSRDYLALIADMVLKSSGHNTVAVFALIENPDKKELYLDVSLRTKSRTLDLNRIIKQITSNGGGRQYKGAYQVKLDYFLHTPEKELFWQAVKATTIDILQKNRDTLYRAGIENIYSAFKEKLAAIFNKD